MTRTSFATASEFQRVKMIEAALEKLLDRGPEIEVGVFGSEDGPHVWVWAGSCGCRDDRVGISLYDLACELEAML